MTVAPWRMLPGDGKVCRREVSVGKGHYSYTGGSDVRGQGVCYDIVHADALRHFPALVTDLGGRPDDLLREAGIDPVAAGKKRFRLEYRSFVKLLLHSAERLEAVDFGLRLAQYQRGGGVIGPIGVVMKNSNTVGEALGYCAKHIHAYCLATRVRFTPDRANHNLFMELEILLDGTPDARQVVEHALLLANLNIIDITDGRARVRRVHFRHSPRMPLLDYRSHFGCEVLFNAEADGIVITEDDLLCEIVDPDEQVYEMATSFIENHFPAALPPTHTLVRQLIVQLLGTGDCTLARVAEEMGMHPRTLQRRLRSEDHSFENIKEAVRQEVAIRYLKQSEIPLNRVAERLGYAQCSVLSRSCFRWFNASPLQLRRSAAKNFRAPAN